MQHGKEGFSVAASDPSQHDQSLALLLPLVGVSAQDIHDLLERLLGVGHLEDHRGVVKVAQKVGATVLGTASNLWKWFRFLRRETGTIRGS